MVQVSATQLPLITIITPSFNRADLIGKAIDSVQHQNYPFVEHIIVDGNSTDDTPEILGKYPHLKVLREADQGVYDALNKGLRIARGEYIGFLNTDDFFSEGVFGEIVERFETSQAAAVAGQAVLFLHKKNEAYSVFRRTRLLTEGQFWRELTYGDPAFNSWFFHRRVFDQIGDFDITYRYISDREFLLRFALSSLPQVALEKVVYWYRAHPGSLTFSQNLQGFSKIADEYMRLADHYQGRVPPKARGYFRRMRTRDTITAASRNLRAGAYPTALRYARLGWQTDKLWPAKFIFRLITGIFRVMGRKLGVYPPI